MRGYPKITLVIFILLLSSCALGESGDEFLYEVWTNQGAGYINKQGEMIIQPQKKIYGQFSEGLAFYNENGKDGYVNRKGEVVIEAKYNLVYPFSEGRAKVRGEGGWGFIDKNGNEIVRPQYDLVESFSEGLAKVKIQRWDGDISDDYFFIDKDGEIVLDIKKLGYYTDNYYAVSNRFSDGYICVSKNVGKAYIEMVDYAIDKQGQLREDVLIDGKCYTFTEGLTRVGGTGGMGFMDKNGDLAVEKNLYFTAHAFSEGLVAFQKSENEYRWGYVDTNGAIVIEPKFSHAEDFKNGLARASLPTDNIYDIVMVYIDKTGRIIWKAEEPFTITPGP